MLDDKIREYEKTKKMLKNTPAMYKREYPFLKEVDSLALANVQRIWKRHIHQSFYDSGGFSVRQNINCLSFSAKVLIFHSLI